MKSPNTKPDQQNAALNPTVELTRTDANNIEEYIMRHSDIDLVWYVLNLSNTRVRQTSHQHWERQDTIQLPPAKRILHNINLWDRPHHRMSVHILTSPRGHRSAMPARGIWHKPSKRTIPKKHIPNRSLCRRAEENPTDQENSSCCRHDGHGRDWGKDKSVLSVIEQSQNTVLLTTTQETI